MLQGDLFWFDLDKYLARIDVMIVDKYFFFFSSHL